VAGQGGDLNELMRRLPGVDTVIEQLSGAPHPILAEVARRAVDEARKKVSEGAEAPSLEDVIGRARSLLARHGRELLRPVINATGVLIHTNLGRAPLGERQLEAVRRIAGGYSNLEYDLEAGRRGDRYSHAGALFTALTGAESALVVNNNAAAVLLALTSLCRDREVIISRGELIEIGGEFRIPDVMEQSGTRLVEVGTTNRTHLADYERAITPDTAALLKVHTSNYRIVGFSSSVPVRDLARLARGRRTILLSDLGSGLIELPGGLSDSVRGEPSVGAALEDGADVVTFSGDKLLGGPQAGIILGRRDLIATMARNPLLRALRVDKMTLAALEETLLAHLEHRADDIPIWVMLNLSPDELRARAERLAKALEETLSEGFKLAAVPSHAVTGGGSLPGREIESWAIALVHPERSADDLQTTLRSAEPPVVGRIEEDRLLLDICTVPADLDDAMLSALMSMD
jgi:L-seryl-tRNA(Ser) seleniumtransferase